MTGGGESQDDGGDDEKSKTVGTKLGEFVADSNDVDERMRTARRWGGVVRVFACNEDEVRRTNKKQTNISRARFDGRSCNGAI